MRYRTLISAGVPLMAFAVTIVVLERPQLGSSPHWSMPTAFATGGSTPASKPAETAPPPPPPQFTASQPTATAVTTRPVIAPPVDTRELSLRAADHAFGAGRPPMVKPERTYDDPNAPEMPVRFSFRGPLRGDPAAAALVNTSSEETVEVRVTAVNPTTQARSVISVQLEPSDRVDLIQQGLKLGMGDTVMLQSSHYRDQVVQAW